MDIYQEIIRLRNSSEKIVASNYFIPSITKELTTEFMKKAILDFSIAHEEKVTKKLVELLYTMSLEEAEINFKKLDSLSKGEKTVFIYILEGAKNSKKIDIIENSMWSKTAYFTPLTKSQKKNAKRKMNSMSIKDIELLKDMAYSTLRHGMRQESLKVNTFNIDYTNILKKIQGLKGMKNYSLNKLKIAFNSIYLLRNDKNDIASLGSDLLKQLFTSQYRKVLDILEENRILIKHSNHIANYKSATYKFFNVFIEGEEKIYDKKAIKWFKKISVEKYKLSVEKRKELRDEMRRALNGESNPVLDMFDKMEEARNYVINDFNEKYLHKYKGLAKKYKDSSVYEYEIFGSYFHRQVENLNHGFIENYKEYADAYIEALGEVTHEESWNSLFEAVNYKELEI